MINIDQIVYCAPCIEHGGHAIRLADGTELISNEGINSLDDLMRLDIGGPKGLE